MDRTVARLNVEHYRRLLAAELDEAKRRTLQQLLADEETKRENRVPEEKRRP
jgi:hypothetical protein